MPLKLGELSTVLRLDDRPMEQGLDQAEGKFKRFGNKLEPLAMGIGAAAALALAAGLAGAMELDAAQTKLQAQLGGNAEYAEQMGAIAGRVYARGFGESAQQIGDTLRAVLNSGLVSEDDSDEVIEALTVKVQALAQTFDVDVTAGARAAGQMIRNGLAKDGAEAMDILTRAFQETGDQAGDLLDTYSEYSVQFAKLGLDGKESTGLLIQGLKAGARDVDTVADAIKEFSIRAIDGSTTSADGFKALGLNAKDMTRQIASGGEGAQKGLDIVLDRLRAMEDPVARDAAAVALFGTKAEDMGAALLALDTDTAADRLGNVAGAADRVGDALEDSASQKLEAFKRSAQAALVEQVAKAIPYLEGMAKWLGENRDVVEPLAIILGTLAGVIMLIVAATKIWTVVQTALNVVMMLNPLGLFVLAVLAIVAGITILWMKSAAFRDFWIMVWGGIVAGVTGAVDGILSYWQFMIELVVGAALRWWSTMKTVYSAIGQGAAAAFNWIVSRGTAFVNWVGGLKGRLAVKVSGMWDSMKTAFRSALNWIIGKWNSLGFRLPSVTVAGQTWGGATLSTPDLPYLAGGGTAREAGMAYIAERGKEAVYLPQGASVQPLGPGDTASGGGAIHGELSVIGELRVRGSDLVMVLRDKARVTNGGVVALIDGR
ncbi:phage tail tape measure protein [Micromonospora sp. WMMC250]|uniref:phage tail tape measure protein n=1 Tax=Micromonospora sp. WMMC250 TaxID=3014781 RepID=UPI0022B6A96A|nr:phage tail tape measure protein [Micromonospora sp. WMMC250]MCZ7376552.1 phage tail tape measure protein [Micromonospora sp. WMMC250]